ncbi:type VI secretion system lipoprotein TssJ [Zestomonas carbonaria]|uniref:Type VI secretion system lipoprotein TssJ n=1 Tax=Zestomonas carbonaria TaxID=2762745 RepID=A0A7U7IAD6_9GAMM|nr:type VI secretion system lipoprotein TssJ [Pseudomonas carbonaria]CAD5109359.1 hypothetical protein PSEWESI4_03656 [Pseudomonas carbonaria]
MKARRPILLLLAGTLIGGCGLFGGEKEKAPPTQLSLSLYAAPDVNPNPASVQPEPTDATATPPGAAPVQQAGLGTGNEGPYRINLSGSSHVDLTEKLRALLEYMQQEGTGSSEYGKKPSLSLQFDPALQMPGKPSAHPAPDKSAWRPGVPFPIDTDQPPALGQYAEEMVDGLQERQNAFASREAATPITFKVLQLKDDSLFLSADHDMLTKNLKKALGKTYLDDDDYVLQPGQFKFIDYAEIDEKTHYLAVMANFHNQDGAVWKQVLRLEPTGHKYAVLVTLTDTQVAITDESYRQPKPRPTP